MKRRARASRPREARVRLINRSGYDSSDLLRFLTRGARILGIRKPLEITVTASPIRSRGCAEVGGRRMVLALAPPSYSRSRGQDGFMKRLAKLYKHELLHIRGLEHKDMNETDLYSEGPLPAWARGLKIRYRGRTPRQMRLLS